MQQGACAGSVLDATQRLMQRRQINERSETRNRRAVLSIQMRTREASRRGRRRLSALKKVAAFNSISASLVVGRAAAGVLLELVGRATWQAGASPREMSCGKRGAAGASTPMFCTIEFVDKMCNRRFAKILSSPPPRRRPTRRARRADAADQEPSPRRPAAPLVAAAAPATRIEPSAPPGPNADRAANPRPARSAAAARSLACCRPKATGA